MNKGPHVFQNAEKTDTGILAVSPVREMVSSLGGLTAMFCKGWSAKT